MKTKVLVVDDDLDFLKVMKVWLERDGYEVAVAVDGLSGITAARKEAPDLIVLDVGMPAGGGATALERMRRLVPLAGVRFVVVTGQSLALAAQFPGADGFVHKMEGKERILGVLRQAMLAPLD